MRASPAGGSVPAGRGEPGKAGARGAAPQRGGLAGGWRRLAAPRAGMGEQPPCLPATRAKYPAVPLPRRHLSQRGCGRHRGQSRAEPSRCGGGRWG